MVEMLPIRRIKASIGNQSSKRSTCNQKKKTKPKEQEFEGQTRQNID